MGFIVMVKVCHDWCSLVFSLYNSYHSRLRLNYFYRGVFDNMENTLGGSTAFLATALASSSASMFFVLLICSTMNPLK
jgi:hypothetical protein